MRVLNLVMKAKAKFKLLLRARLDRMNESYKSMYGAGNDKVPPSLVEGEVPITRKEIREQEQKMKDFEDNLLNLNKAKKKEHERKCFEIMDKCRTLKTLHPMMKTLLVDKMQFTYLVKG